MKHLVTLLVGLVLGAVVAIFFLGIPRSKSTPGAKVQAPDAGTDQGNTVVVSLNNQFVDGFLSTIFRDLGAPSFKLAALESEAFPISTRRIAFQEGCVNTITLAPEGSNTRTEVKFNNGKISAPLAFSGAFTVLGNCMQFKGWAETTIQLRFDQEKQTVYGQVNVEGVNLEGLNPVANNFITVFVRNAIDERVNPLELIKAPQLQLMIPVKASNGAVKAHVKDVRAEMLEGSLKLHISYEFTGERAQPPQS